MENRLSMLVVDDMSINRSLLRNIFDDEYRIYESENGQKALAVLEEKEIDIILLDLVMPVMDGMTVLEKLREKEDYARIPVIITTVVNDTESEIKAMDLGADEFITKPYNPQLIRRRVSNLVGKYINDRRLIKKELREASEQLQLLVDTIPGGIATFEVREEIACTFMNERLCQLLGYTPQEAEEEWRSHFTDLIYEADREMFSEELRLHGGKSKKRIHLTLRIWKKDGTYMWAGIDGQRMSREEEQLQYYLIFTDRTQEKQAMQQVKDNMSQLLTIVEQDSLTGLYNRRTFYEKTRQRLEEDTKSEYVIAQWNMDQFKVINVLYGSTVGDKVLMKCAAVIESLVYEYGFCGRLEADRFVTLLKRECLDSKMAEIENILSEGVYIEEIDHPILLHVGFYIITDRTIPVDVMCDFANLAMQEVKKNYLKRWEFFNEELRVNMMNEQLLVNEMEQALREHQFLIYLQPVYDANTFEIVSAEALVRWKHPVQGMISPGIFIPLFEKNGFIARLDMYVWEETCRIISENRKEGRPVVPVSVNVSRINFYNSNLAAEIRQMVEKYGLDCSYVKFEITESAYTENPYQLMKVIEDLRSMGFLILMDDFGSGYSSLNTLKDVPVDILKIDMKFLDHLENSPKATNILFSVVKMAKSLDMKIIVEGVETQNEFEMLRSMGCDFIQGYYFSRPLPVEEFEQKLDQNRSEKIEPRKQEQPSILVVDDMEINRASICASIADQYPVIEVEDGEAAWNYLIHHPLGIQMVITDIMMPKLDGFGLMERMRSSSMFDQIPIMVLTSINEAENEKKAILCGAQDVISRPFDSVILLQRVKNLLRLSAAEDIQVEMNSLKENYASGSQQRKLLDENIAAIACIKVDHKQGGEEIRLLYANAYYYEIHEIREGDTPEDFVDGFYRKIEKEDQTRLQQYLQVEEEGQNVQDVYSMIRDDGPPLTILFSAAFHQDASGMTYIDIIETPLDISQMFLQDKVIGSMLNDVLANLHLNFWTYDMINDTFLYHSGSYEGNFRPEYIQNASQKILEMPEYEEADYDRVRQMYRRLHLGETSVEEVFHVKRARTVQGTEEYGWVRIVYRNFFDVHNRPAVAIGIAIDITSEIELQQAKRQESRYRAILSKGVWFFADVNVNTGQYTLERDGGREAVPGRKERDSLIRYDLALLKYVTKFVHPDDRRKCREILGRENMKRMYQEGTKEIQLEFRSKTALSQKEYQWFMAAVFMTEYEEDHHINANMQVRNVQTEHFKLQNIKRQAEKDIMTGCYNRATFEKKVNQICKADPKAKVAFIMVDADNFKNVNDTFGHDTGDVVLKTMANQLMQTFRKEDLVGRLGGDEFAVFISDAQAEDVIIGKAEDICRRIYMPLEKDGRKVIISCSVGMAVKQNTSFNDLYVCADQAQYRAKKSGKNKFELYEN